MERQEKMEVYFGEEEGVGRDGGGIETGIVWRWRF
jgi:hypothetical protein